MCQPLNNQNHVASQLRNSTLLLVCAKLFTFQQFNIYISEFQVVIDNVILQLRIANPEGYLTGVCYGGVDNVLETRNEGFNRGYATPLFHLLVFFGLGFSLNLLTRNNFAAHIYNTDLYFQNLR
ncbi:hypothetical protein RND81_12G045600 [Saponaria officinalis]|uniref:Uncharacterized protein n=1 Tax=Saponaria officinalis TaxID=3572 RepID=A0AAW1H6L5_SAPOF